ncbi:cyanate hydratase, partial [Alteromonadaceae bacterium A_SAG1]|nr:cyanate hydratase [Alteromonadaceae bacterium A_SAG1]
MITSRTQVTDMIQSAKILKGIKWSQIAEVVGQSKE